MANNHLIYVIGGSIENNVQRSVEVYNVLKKEWTRLCDMETARSNHAVALFENKIYAVGGYSGRGNILLFIVEKYDNLSDGES